MTIKTHPLRLGQKGFTLIEIVMVLVLLGILAAVAVPKYFDLQKEAEERAMATVEAEIRARFNALFAKDLLEGKKCEFSTIQSIIGNEITYHFQNDIKDNYELEITEGGPEEGYVDFTVIGKHGERKFRLVTPECGKTGH